MEHPEGTVVLLESGTGAVRALVVVDPSAACPRCAAGKGCGAGILATGRGVRRVEVAVPDGMELTVGDRVALSLLPENLLTAATIAYGIPLGGAVAGAALAVSALVCSHRRRACGARVDPCARVPQLSDYARHRNRRRIGHCDGFDHPGPELHDRPAP